MIERGLWRIVGLECEIVRWLNKWVLVSGGGMGDVLCTNGRIMISEGVTTMLSVYAALSCSSIQSFKVLYFRYTTQQIHMDKYTSLLMCKTKTYLHITYNISLIHHRRRFAQQRIQPLTRSDRLRQLSHLNQRCQSFKFRFTSMYMNECPVCCCCILGTLSQCRMCC